MQTADIIQHAHALYRAHGDKAEAEAAQRAVSADTATEKEVWTKIRAQIRRLRGPNMT